MAVKDIIARGIGFSPGKVAFIVTHGLLAAAAPGLPIILPDIGGEPERRRRRKLLRLQRAAEEESAREFERQREEAARQEALQELEQALAAMQALLQPSESLDALTGLLGPFRTQSGVDMQAALADQQRVAELARLAIEAQEEAEDAEAVLFMMAVH